jgi:hypothetical protein
MSGFNLKSFNTDLSKIESDIVQSYIKTSRLVNAMGWTWQKSRKQYEWWELGDLERNPDEKWNEAVSTEPSLRRVFKDAQFRYGKKIDELQGGYRCDREKALELLKCYIGYSPAYGAYICFVGTYLSTGGGHGIEHVVQEAVHKFNFYILRKGRTTEAYLAKALARVMAQYIKSFPGIQFEKGDFRLIIKSQAGDYVPFGDRQADKQDDRIVNNLDPASPESQEFSQDAEMLGDQSVISLNTKGYEKIIRALMGPVYTRYLEERAVKENKTVDQITQEILSNMESVRNLYMMIRKRWQQAKLRGEPVGDIEPPEFGSRKFQLRKGAQIPTTPKETKLMTNQLMMRREVLQNLIEGISDPKMIAQRLQNTPDRVEKNKRRTVRHLPPIKISPLVIQRIINEVEAMRPVEGRADLRTYQEILQELDDNIASYKNPDEELRAFKNLKSAFEMCAIYFSSRPLIDPATNATLGAVNRIIFNPPPNFKNYTTTDLLNFVQTGALQPTGEPPPPEAATEQDIIKGLGKEVEELEVQEAMEDPEEVEDKLDEEEAIIEGKPETEIAGEAAAEESEEAIAKLTEKPTVEQVAPVVEEPLVEPVPETVEVVPVVPKAKEKKTKPAKPMSKKPTPKPTKKPSREETEEETEDIRNLMGNTITNLIKIAEELDNDGKYDDAEEVHKVIRKYEERLQ